MDVAPAWSTHPVAPYLYTRPPQQFVVFFDENRQLTVMARAIDSKDWSTIRLGEYVIWDSHNYGVIAADPKGFLHLSGNMHNTPLVYFRSASPMDISTFNRVDNMTGSEEDKVTYPKFLKDAEGNLMFNYRHGASGKGDHIFNRYSPEAGFWSRVLFQSLTTGEGDRSAYFDEFRTTPDGMTHVCWIWRDTADAVTNNTLCYARTRDFREWENAAGEPLKLPLRRRDPIVVDPVPPEGGLVNGGYKLGFTADRRPVIAYTKYDGKGHNQIYAAGWTGSAWVSTQLTDYEYRWEVSGRGIFSGEIGIRRPTTAGGAPLSVQWTHKEFGTRRRLLDPKTFAPGEMAPALSDGIPKELRTPTSTHPEMQVRFSWDAGSTAQAPTRYVLRWESLPPNRDQPRPRPWPDAVTMRVYKLPAPQVEN